MVVVVVVVNGGDGIPSQRYNDVVSLLMMRYKDDDGEKEEVVLIPHRNIIIVKMARNCQSLNDCIFVSIGSLELKIDVSKTPKAQDDPVVLLTRSPKVS